MLSSRVTMLVTANTAGPNFMCRIARSDNRLLFIFRTPTEN